MIDHNTMILQICICCLDSQVGEHILAHLLSTLLQDNIRVFFLIIIHTKMFLQYQTIDSWYRNYVLQEMTKLMNIYELTHNARLMNPYAFPYLASSAHA
jgi:ABC-type anion transport system duplicated permease subunit